MSAALILPPWGQDLTEADYQNLAARWIDRSLAAAVGLRRVDSITGRQMFARKRGDLAGILIPNISPWDATNVREYRLRLDNPELEYRIDGTSRETGKYIQPPGRGNLIYFPPGIDSRLLEDTTVPVIITEGEFKALALWRLANHNTNSPRFLPIAFAGVWSFRGTVGKTDGPNGDRRDIKGVIADLDRIVLSGRPVIIAYDADAEDNPSVRAARWKLTGALTERRATVGVLNWPIEQGKGIDDRLATIGPDRVLADIAAVEFGDWQNRLLRNNKGDILSCYENVALFLEYCTEWSGVLGYNEFTGGLVVLKEPPSPISATIGSELEDHFDTDTVRWLERRGVMVKPDVVRRVVDCVARRNTFHPVRDYLEGLPQWDGVPRIGSWPIDYLGVESSDSNPNRYAMAVGEKFLISAVARVMEPGCKADHLLVLEGPQGIGKSTVVRILAGEWFSDQLAEMGSKDASMQLRGVWIMELSELGALNRTELAREKAFLTQQTERFRLPYGHRIVDLQRQCVFIGTTNSDGWLKDETGGRRFWPVRCTKIDLAALERDRDQLWAEALHRYRSGVPWWLEDPEVVKNAIEEQRGRYTEDVWQGEVEALAEKESAKEGSVSITEILAGLGIETAKQDQAAANRVARCLRVAGYERFNKRLRSKKFQKRYRKVDRN